MLGTNFPISELYRDNLLDAQTISRTGGWWTAVLIIKDPRSDRPFVKLYKWQHTERGWKMRSGFKINSAKDGKSIAEALSGFAERLS